MGIRNALGRMSAAVLATFAVTMAVLNNPSMGRLASADSIVLTGTIRDFPPESGHPDYTVEPQATPGARSSKNIQLTLDEDGKPVFIGGGKRVQQEWRDVNGKKISWCIPSAPGDNPGHWGAPDNGGIQSTATYGQWFRDVPGINMSRLWSIELTNNGSGVYIYDTNNFHPIDEQLLGNGPDEHNFYFSYEIVCEFTYSAAANQYVSFIGDDDCWVFVDGKLAIDHGGIVANRELRADINRLGLTDGQKYSLRFFLAERQQPQSQFHLETNIELESAGGSIVFAAYD